MAEISKEVEQKIIEYILQGLNVPQIQEIIKISDRSIAMIRKRNNLPDPYKHRKADPKIKARNQKIIEEAMAGTRIVELAEKYKLSASAVRNVVWNSKRRNKEAKEVVIPNPNDGTHMTTRRMPRPEKIIVQGKQYTDITNILNGFTV